MSRARAGKLRVCFGHSMHSIDESQLDELCTRPDEAVVETLRQCPGEFAVLGAGGKMGFHLSRMLQRGLEELGRTDRIHVVSRFADEKKQAQFLGSGFEVHALDMSDAGQLHKLPQADHVFYLAGVKFGTAAQPELLHQMNVYMPGLIANHYCDSTLVALSTGCVYSFTTPESGGSTEESPVDPPGEYAVSCLGREQAFTRSSIRHGTPTSIIRLNYSVECRYGVLVDIAAAVLAEQEISLDTGFVNVIWQGDAVRYTVKSLKAVSTPPFILNVTGPVVLSVREIADQFGFRFGKMPRFEGREKETAWLNNAALSHKMYGVPSVKLEKMLDWVATWLLNGSPILNKPTQFQVRDGSY